MRAALGRPMSRARLVVLLCIAIAAAGCANPGDEGGGGGALAATSVDILVDWSPDAARYVIDVARGSVATATLSVRDDAGNEGETPIAPHAGTGGAEYSVPSPIELVADREYTIELRVGDTVVASRVVRALNESLGAPGKSLKATYDISMTMAEAGDSRREMSLAGTAVADKSAAGLREAIQVGGTMVQEGDGMSMTIAVALEVDALDDVTERQLLTGDGEWVMDGEQGEGEGTVQLRQEFVTYEEKLDADGVAHRASKTATSFEMQGDFVTQGIPAQLDGSESGFEWRRADTRDLIWRKSDGETVITVAGQPNRQPKHVDEPVPYGDEQAPLIDAVRWEGPVPYPPRAGDSVVQHGLGGLSVRYSVDETDALTIAGRTFEALLVTGVVSGAQGNETWRLVAEGDLAGLLLTGHGRYERGDETFEVDATLREIEG